MEFFVGVTGMLDKGEPVDIICIDFQKAFDKVPHQRLCRKLESHGINGNVLNWIQGWLKNRKQRVDINGSQSEWSGVSSGVPQGSVLGPVLFLICINDIDSAVDTLIKKFADDTKLYAGIKTEEQARSLQNSLHSVLKWGQDWQMLFNLNKCKDLHVGRNNPNVQYFMDGIPLENVTEEKDLGVTVTESFKPSKQCSISAAKANRILGIIKKTFSSRDSAVIAKLYKSLVRPHLEYAIQAWSPYLQRDIDTLEKVQRRATKMVEGIEELSYEDRLEYLNLTTLITRRLRGDLIEVFKILKGTDDLPKEYLFQMRSEDKNRLRGHSFMLETPKARLDIRKNSFSHRIVTEWNRLPPAVVDADSVNVFKNRIDEHFKNIGLV